MNNNYNQLEVAVVEGKGEFLQRVCHRIEIAIYAENEKIILKRSGMNMISICD
jgi:hypothetical protein